MVVFGSGYPEFPVEKVCLQSRLWRWCLSMVWNSYWGKLADAEGYLVFFLGVVLVVLFPVYGKWFTFRREKGM